MSCRYSLIIWDVDGTLLDTSKGILDAAKYVIEKANLPMPSDDVIKTYIGPPIQDSFTKSLSISRERALELAEEFRKRYKNHDLLKAIPYDGILDVCKKFKIYGIKQAVATYKREDYANEIVRHFGFSKYIDSTCGSDFDGKLTKTDIICNAINSVGAINPADVLMIGDTDNDKTGAQKQNIDFLAVTYGFGFKKNTCHINQDITYIANSPKEILSILGV